jgi:hypothetical protein
MCSMQAQSQCSHAALTVYELVPPVSTLLSVEPEFEARGCSGVVISSTYFVGLVAVDVVLLPFFVVLAGAALILFVACRCDDAVLVY